MQSVIDDNQLQIIQVAASDVKQQLATGQYASAYDSYKKVSSLLDNYDGDIDFYDFRVFHKSNTDKRTLFENGE